MRTLTAAVLVAAVAAVAPAADRTAGMSKGTPEVKSISALAFGPDGILFVGDATGDTKAGNSKDEYAADDLRAAAGDLFGSKADGITINDLKVNPASGNLY